MDTFGKTPVSARPGAIGRGADAIEGFVASIRRLSLAGSVDEVMSTVTPAARQLLKADGVTFVLRDGELCHYADEDAIAPLWKGRRFPMDSCISGWCMKQGTAVRIPDIYADERIPQDAYRPTFVRSLAMAPVRKEDPIAAMGAYWAEERRCSTEELDLLQTMADASALAIAHAASRQRDEDHEFQLRRDSHHRVKSAFALALALARQTAGENVEEYRTALAGRLEALEQAHSAIFEEHGRAVDVCGLLHRLLAAAGHRGRMQINCTAVDCRMSQAEAVDFALAVNELAVNAKRFGAWSTSSGRVKVDCSLTDRGILFVWQEEGGPRVQQPARTGLGTRLLHSIAEGNPGGRLLLEFEPTGLICELEFATGPT